jgi:hypothetical protein
VPCMCSASSRSRHSSIAFKQRRRPAIQGPAAPSKGQTNLQTGLGHRSGFGWLVGECESRCCWICWPLGATDRLHFLACYRTGALCGCVTNEPRCGGVRAARLLVLTTCAVLRVPNPRRRGGDREGPSASACVLALSNHSR